MSEQVTKTPSVAKKFRETVMTVSVDLLREWVGEAKYKEAVGRVSTALATAASNAKNPEEFYKCTPNSVGAVVAISALTGIMVGADRNALAYAIPRRPRKKDRDGNEVQPNLTYQLSHRGVAALARRSGYTLIPIPITVWDVIGVDDSGNIVIKEKDLDKSATKLEELKGVLVKIADLETGRTIHMGWVNRQDIEKRRNGSDAYKYAESKEGEWSKPTSPWHAWPIEQAMKTAMHYAITRGWVVIDDVSALRAIQSDQENDTVEGTCRPVSERPKTLSDLTNRMIEPPTDQATTVELGPTKTEPEKTVEQITKDHGLKKGSEILQPKKRDKKTDDWPAQINSCTTRAQLTSVWNKINQSGAPNIEELFDQMEQRREQLESGS